MNVERQYTDDEFPGEEETRKEQPQGDGRPWWCVPDGRYHVVVDDAQVAAERTGTVIELELRVASGQYRGYRINTRLRRSAGAQQHVRTFASRLGLFSRKDHGKRSLTVNVAAAQGQQVVVDIEASTYTDGQGALRWRQDVKAKQIWSIDDPTVADVVDADVAQQIRKQQSITRAAFETH